VILLDTNALIWLETGHGRARPLLRSAASLYVSPATALELQFLVELGKIRFKHRESIAELLEDDRWSIDEPPSLAWFDHAREFTWTRDPFDRLIVAHARLRRWKLATGDTHVISHVGARGVIEL
jgi:PIN domain nuclease of toxin-antitoxin system